MRLEFEDRSLFTPYSMSEAADNEIDGIILCARGTVTRDRTTNIDYSHISPQMHSTHASNQHTASATNITDIPDYQFSIDPTRTDFPNAISSHTSDSILMHSHEFSVTTPT